MLEFLQPVMRNLSDPDTGLDRFIRASAAAAAEVAPVAEVQGELFGNLDVTFTALAEVARPFIQETISETPPTFAVGERAAAEDPPVPRRQRRAVHAAAAGGRRARPLLADDRPDARGRDPRGPRFADPESRADPTSEALLAFNDDPVVRDGLDPPAPDHRHLRPGDQVHRAGADRLQLRHPAGAEPRRRLRRGLDRGQVAAVLGLSAVTGPNNLGGVASAAANGGGGAGNFLSFNPYPNTASPGQPRECEAGNERFIAGQQVIGNSRATREPRPPGNRPRSSPRRPKNE